MPTVSCVSSLKSVAFAVGVAVIALSPLAARAEALLVVEADTGKVLQAENATIPWYPASVTKLMTTYVTLKAVKEGRITLDTLVTVSPIAAAQSPSKMGFRSGTQVTIDNALKMMMVKSANDMAVVLAEGVGGSIDGFSALMNENAARLGMTQTSYVNPNGLPAEGQITSARDLAILARAIIRDLPEYEYFVHIPAIKFGRRVTQNFNRLIGRFPGADGMKTGFICASGFNLVATATRNNKRLIAVVLGASSGQMRGVRAAQLLEKGFSANNLSWLRPALGNVDDLVPVNVDPPNLRDEMCGPKRKKPATETEDEVASTTATGETGAAVAFFAAGMQAPKLRPVDMLAAAPSPSEPVIVYTGPKKIGADLIAANAVEEQKQTPKPRVGKGKGKKTTVAAKPDAAASDAAADTKAARVSIMVDTKAAKPAKPAAAKPSVAKPSVAKPAVTTAEKPAAVPAKPKLATKPKAKPAATTAAKPAAASPRS
ncbi:MAG: Serine-type D-Ala-D-Ala carboxypeptidase [Tardiphaga sp.]|nr:Serine-type D-Ala-D-Ala carboxypeptidase [Tardiphaga sp.]